MPGYLALVLHAHLPFVRHPEHERFLEENWLFEAITETYVPLLQIMDGWRRDGMDTRLTLTLSPTLCSMLRDPLLQDRYERHLNGLIELAEKEIHRTHWDKRLPRTGVIYHRRFTPLRDAYAAYGRDLVGAFRKFQELGQLEIITTAATHALLPLLADHPPSLRAQILVARDHYRSCFGRDPRGIWLPECAYVEASRTSCRRPTSAGSSLDTHGMLHAQPRPRYGVFAPDLHAQRHRRLWPRPRFRAAGLEPARRLSRRRALPRFLPRHRVRPRFRLREAASALARTSAASPASNITASPAARRTRRSIDRAAALHAADEHAGHFLARAHRASPAARRNPGPPAAGGRAVRRGVVRPLVV